MPPADAGSAGVAGNTCTGERGWPTQGATRHRVPKESPETGPIQKRRAVRRSLVEQIDWAQTSPSCPHRRKAFPRPGSPRVFVTRRELVPPSGPLSNWGLRIVHLGDPSGRVSNWYPLVDYFRTGV